MAITMSNVSCVLKNLEHDKAIVMKGKYLFVIFCVGNFLVALSSGDLTKALQIIVVTHQNRCNNRQAESW